MWRMRRFASGSRIQLEFVTRSIWATSWENLFMPCANTKGADQPAHPRSLISTLVVRYLDSIIPLVSAFEISSLYLASVAAKGGLGLTRSQTPKTGFLITRLIWARSCENVSYAICEQQRCRSACSFAQSDQHFCCSLLRQYDMYTCSIKSFKILASFCSWAGWFKSYLVAKPEDMFPDDVTHIMMKKRKLGWYITWSTTWHWVFSYPLSALRRLWLDKTNKVTVRPAKTQISLGIRPVWSESSLSAWRKAWVLSYPLSAQRWLWSDWADVQANLSLRWAHSHFVGFVVSRLISQEVLGWQRQTLQGTVKGTNSRRRQKENWTKNIK